MNWPAVRERARQWAPWAAAALGLSIPLSKAADAFLLVLVLLLWLAGGRYGEKLRFIGKNPVAWVSLLLFALTIGGLFYGKVDKDSLSDAKTFILIPLLLPLFGDPRFRKYGLRAFLTAMGFVLLVSWLLFFDLLPPGGFWKGIPENPYVVHQYITQNVLMAFAAAAWAGYARLGKNPAARAGAAVLAVAAVANILFLIPGKTGHVILAVLILYYFMDWLGWRKGVPAALGMIVLLFGIVFAFPGSALHQRTTQAVREFREWGPGQESAGVVNAIGYRMEFWRTSWSIFLDRPWTGAGTGGFPGAYAEKVQGTDRIVTDNPHSQYLLTAVELGVVGLAALLALFAVQWRTSASLPGPVDPFLARSLVLTLATGSLFNSLLSDHTESLFFVFLSALLFAGLADRGKT